MEVLALIFWSFSSSVASGTPNSELSEGEQSPVEEEEYISTAETTSCLFLSCIITTEHFNRPDLKPAELAERFVNTMTRSFPWIQSWSSADRFMGYDKNAIFSRSDAVHSKTTNVFHQICAFAASSP